MNNDWEKVFDTTSDLINNGPPKEQLVSRIKIHKEMHDRLSDDEIHEYIHQQIARDFVNILLEAGLIQVTNLTLEQDRNGGYNHDHADELEAFYERGEVTFQGKLNLTISPRGAAVLKEFQERYGKRTETKVIYKDQFTQDQLDYIWKMMPPRINKRDPKQHPLNHGWFGTIERPGDEKIRETLAKALKQKI